MGRPIFTEVLSHYGKNPVLSREVTTWEKHQLFSTAGYASVPAFIADRYFGRVPHQPAQPPSRQPLLLGGGRDCAQKGRTAAHLLPGSAPGLSAGDQSQVSSAGRMARAFYILPYRRRRNQPAQKRSKPEVSAPPPRGNLYYYGQCRGTALPG